MNGRVEISDRPTRQALGYYTRGAITALTLVFLCASAAFTSASAQDPVPCDRLKSSVNSEFVNPICYRDRWSGRALGWSEHIQAENDRYMISFVYLRATTGHSYVRRVDIDDVFDQFSLPRGVKILSDKATTDDGFEFITVGSPSTMNCFIFLRQIAPIYGGYRLQQSGLVCDKTKNDLYTISDVDALMSKIDFGD